MQQKVELEMKEFKQDFKNLIKGMEKKVSRKKFDER